jgi:hypothetical protein
MWFNELRKRWLGQSPTGGRTRSRAVRPRLRLQLERLEDRAVPADFTATSVTDLIADINAANQTRESDTITLVAGTTFTLTEVNNTTNGPTGLPTIAANGGLTIFGNGDIIERNTAAGTPAFRLLDVAAGASLALDNLTLQGGLALSSPPQYPVLPVSTQGGAIFNQGALILHGVTIQNNTARGVDGFNHPSGYFPIPAGCAAGGGLYSSGSLTMADCTIRNNAAIGGRGYAERYAGVNAGSGWVAGMGGSASGGGLFIGGTATINSSTLTANTAQGGDAGARRDYVSAHGGDGLGGGLYAAGGAVVLHNVGVTENLAQGGYGGSRKLNDGTFGQGIGGGVHIDADALVCLDAFTEDHVKRNHAKSDRDIHGAYIICP